MNWILDWCWRDWCACVSLYVYASVCGAIYPKQNTITMSKMTPSSKQNHSTDVLSFSTGTLNPHHSWFSLPFATRNSTKQFNVWLKIYFTLFTHIKSRKFTGRYSMNSCLIFIVNWEAYSLVRVFVFSDNDKWNKTNFIHLHPFFEMELFFMKQYQFHIQTLDMTFLVCQSLSKSQITLSKTKSHTVYKMYNRNLIFFLVWMQF